MGTILKYEQFLSLNIIMIMKCLINCASGFSFGLNDTDISFTRILTEESNGTSTNTESDINWGVSIGVGCGIALVLLLIFFIIYKICSRKTSLSIEQKNDKKKVNINDGDFTPKSNDKSVSVSFHKSSFEKNNRMMSPISSFSPTKKVISDSCIDKIDINGDNKDNLGMTNRSANSSLNKLESSINQTINSKLRSKLDEKFNKVKTQNLKVNSTFDDEVFRETETVHVVVNKVNKTEFDNNKNQFDTNKEKKSKSNAYSILSIGAMKRNSNNLIMKAINSAINKDN